MMPRTVARDGASAVKRRYLATGPTVSIARLPNTQDPPFTAFFGAMSFFAAVLFFALVALPRFVFVGMVPPVVVWNRRYR